VVIVAIVRQKALRSERGTASGHGSRGYFIFIQISVFIFLAFANAAPAPND
jgi:hypothetical protein